MLSVLPPVRGLDPACLFCDPPPSLSLFVALLAFPVLHSASPARDRRPRLRFFCDLRPAICDLRSARLRLRLSASPAATHSLGTTLVRTSCARLRLQQLRLRSAYPRRPRLVHTRRLLFASTRHITRRSFCVDSLASAPV